MLRVADVRPDDLVVDLGSGDGRIVIAAARDYGARGLGIEIDPKLVDGEHGERPARRRRRPRRVSPGRRAQGRFRRATVVTMYLLPHLVEQLKPRLLALKPGTRIVAHDFGFPDWRPDRTVNISKNYYLYVVPARVAGKWRLQAELPERRARATSSSSSRPTSGYAAARALPGGYLPAFEAQLTGDRIGFVLVDERHEPSFRRPRATARRSRAWCARAPGGSASRTAGARRGCWRCRTKADVRGMASCIRCWCFAGVLLPAIAPRRSRSSAKHRLPRTCRRRRSRWTRCCGSPR